MHPYMSPPPHLPFLSVFLFLCVTSASLNANESLLPLEKRPFYLNVPGRFMWGIQWAVWFRKLRGSAGELQTKTHTHTHTELCIHMGETHNTQHPYSHVQETLNRKYIRNYRYIYLHIRTNTRRKASYTRWTFTHTGNTKPQIAEQTHGVRTYETWWRQVFYQQVQLRYRFLPGVHHKHYRPAGSFTASQGC